MTDSDRYILKPSDRLTCPKCEHEFSLEQGFARQALEGIEAASAATLKGWRDEEKATQEKRALAREKELLAAQQQKIEDARALAARQAQEAASLQLDSVKKQYELSQQQLVQLRSEQVNLIAERQKIKDAQAGLELEIQKRLAAEVAQRESQVREQEAQRFALDKAQMQKRMDDLAAQLSDAQRRAEQGSQQLQGEVLELALEEGLKRSFPLDQIEEVKKGQRGGDVLHRVVSRSGAIAGLLLWETKRAQAWQQAWILKLKEDLRASGGDLGVLVVTPGATPRDWPAGTQFALVDDVWVVTWSVALQLATVLRAATLDVHRQRTASSGKGEKMEAVYDYVTSPQFAQKLKGVHDALGRMREELESEKSQTQQRWARREKQLEAGKLALLGIGGELQGLSQQDLPQLELEAFVLKTGPGSAA